ncbi:ferric hydroxamate transport system ATP-binding protein [Mesorhizobium sp. URHB0026]
MRRPGWRNAVTMGEADSQTAFDVDAVCFAVNGRTLLGPVSLELRRTRVYGLIGHNGSGKSTLIKLLARQQPASSGAITFAARPLSQWGARELARALAYLPRTTPAATGLTVRELATLGRYPWHGALGRFGVMLLDEPISALDLAHQVAVLGLVRELSRKRDLCVVVVLHDPNMAARYRDELIALKDGKLLTRGTPDEIMRSDVLKGIFCVEIGVFAHPVTGQPVGHVR